MPARTVTSVKVIGGPTWAALAPTTASDTAITIRTSIGAISEAEEPRDLDDEGTVLHVGKPLQECVVLVVVDHEQFAPGAVLPAQPHIRARAIRARVVLHQRARKHQRCHRVSHARSGKRRG